MVERRLVGLLLFCVALPLGLLGLLWAEVIQSGTLPFDVPGMWMLHKHSSPDLDRLLLLVSRFGYEWGVIPIDIGITVIFLARQRWREACFAASAFAGSALANVAIKNLVQRERPRLWESLAPEGTFSFPSAHAMGSVTLVTVCLLLSWHTRWRLPVLVGGALFAFLVGISRPYLGVHYPSDILAGWSAGLAIACGLYTLFYRNHLPFNSPAAPGL